MSYLAAAERLSNSLSVWDNLCGKPLFGSGKVKFKVRRDWVFRRTLANKFCSEYVAVVADVDAVLGSV